MERSTEPSSRAWVVAATLPLVAYAAGVAGFLLHSPHSYRDFPLDDAWIHRVYARAFAVGQGFAYNDGAQETGATSPLWIVLSAPAHWLDPLGGDAAVVFGVKLIGILAGAVAVALAFGVARRLTASPGASALAACLFALDPRLHFSALSGMEVALLVALWLGAGWAALASRRRTLAVLLGLTPVVRPEAVILVLCALAVLVVVLGPRDGFWRRPLVWIALVGPSFVWSAFCWTVNAHLLPNTFYLKVKPFGCGIVEARLAAAAAVEHGWASHAVLIVGLVLLASWLRPRPRPQAWIVAVVLFLAPILYLVAVVGSRDYRLEGYYWTRWTDPAAMVLSAAVALGLALPLAEVAERIRRGSRPRAGVVLAAAVSLLALVAGAARLAVSYPERRDRLASDSRAVHRINVEAGLWLRDNTPRDAVVGVNDAGALRYFGRRRTIDLVGLNNGDLAFRRGDPRAIVARLDWLAVFPDWFRGSTLLNEFEPRATFRIPLDEYTVCPCPDQTVAVIAQRRTRR